MSGSFYGADVAELHRVADAFDRAAGELQDAKMTVTRGVESSFWVGPVAMRFRTTWNEQHCVRMDRAREALSTEARRLREQAQEQENASATMGGDTLGGGRPNTGASETANDPKVYDEGGKYGGNQSWAYKAYDKGDETIGDIVRRYYPNMGRDEILKLLERARSEGCGYMALVNSLASHYANDPEEFERRFGFPLYAADGSVNYSYMFADLYASQDNVMADIDILGLKFQWRDPWMDYDPEKDGDAASYSLRQDGTGLGTSDGTGPASREFIFEHYLSDRGVSVDVKSHGAVTVAQYQEYAKNGDVVFSSYPFKMYDINGGVLDRDAGHAMIVTGVDERGWLIVSSWGRKYFVNPADYGGDTGRPGVLQVISYGR